MQKVSFIVPIYNVEKYVGQCIESLCNQDEDNVEIILVDDGSTDKSLDICRQYEKIDSRIKVISQTNQGANIARNRGLLEANGEWVCFIDGDDWVEKNVCTAIERYLEKPYDIVMYSYNRVYGNEKKTVSSKCDVIEFGKNDFIDLQIATFNRLGPYKYNVEYLDTVSIWNKMYRRKFLLKNNLMFIPEMPKLQDLTFNLQVYDYANSAIYINVAIYNYRINSESVTNRYQSDIAVKFDIINNFLEEFVKEKKDERYEGVFYERIATHLRTCIVLCYCNKKNKETYIERKKEFLTLLNKEPYYTAMKRVNLNHFSFKEKVLSCAIKYKCFFVCELLYGLNAMLKG